MESDNQGSSSFENIRIAVTSSKQLPKKHPKQQQKKIDVSIDAASPPLQQNNQYENMKFGKKEQEVNSSGVASQNKSLKSLVEIQSNKSRSNQMSGTGSQKSSEKSSVISSLKGKKESKINSSYKMFSPVKERTLIHSHSTPDGEYADKVDTSYEEQHPIGSTLEKAMQRPNKSSIYRTSLQRNDTYQFEDTDQVINKLMDNSNSNLRIRKEFMGKKNQTAIDKARDKLAKLISQYDSLKDKLRIEKKNNSFQSQVVSVDSGVTGNVLNEFKNVMKLRQIEIKIQEAQVSVQMQIKKQNHFKNSVSQPNSQNQSHQNLPNSSSKEDSAFLTLPRQVDDSSQSKESAYGGSAVKVSEGMGSAYGDVIMRDSSGKELKILSLNSPRYPVKRLARILFDKEKKMSYKDRLKKQLIRDIHAKKFNLNTYIDKKHKQEHAQQQVIIDRIRKQHKQRILYNAQIIQELKVIRDREKTWKTMATQEQTTDHDKSIRLQIQENSRTRETGLAPPINQSINESSQSVKLSSLMKSQGQQSVSGTGDTSSLKTDSSADDESPGKEELDGDISSNDSFRSDSSYYDEVEDFDVACINNEQQENLIYSKIAKKEIQKQNRSSNEHSQQIKEDAANLNEIFKIAAKLNRPKLQDKDLPRVFDFMKQLPALGGRFDDLKKNQSRYCIEKMKIKFYNRGTRLFRKGKPHIYAYIVLLGVVNLYDECTHDHEHSDDEHSSQEHSSHVGELITHRNDSHDTSHRSHKPDHKHDHKHEHNHDHNHKHKDKVVYDDESKMVKNSLKSVMQGLVHKEERRQSVLPQAHPLQMQNDAIKQIQESGQVNQSDLRVFKKVIFDKLDSSGTNSLAISKQNTKKIQDISLLNINSVQNSTQKKIEEEREEGTQREHLERRVFDKEMEIIYLNQTRKVASKQSGQVLGSMELVDKSESQNRPYTAFCKTDCILLQLEQDIFNMIYKQKVSREKQNLLKKIVDGFPSILKYYTEMRLLDSNHLYWKEKYLKKDEVLQTEGQEASHMYLIDVGKVKVYKNLSFIDQNEEKVTQEELIMELSTSQIVGEDLLYFNRLNTYTARASTNNTKVFSITNDDFQKFFGKLLFSQHQKSAKFMLQIRNKTFQERQDAIQFSNEYNALQYKPRISKNLQNQWECHQTKVYNDPSEQKTIDKFKKMYIRDDKLLNLPTLEKIKLAQEYHNQMKKSESVLIYQQKLFKKQNQLMSNPKSFHLRSQSQASIGSPQKSSFKVENQLNMSSLILQRKMQDYQDLYHDGYKSTFEEKPQINKKQAFVFPLSKHLITSSNTNFDSSTSVITKAEMSLPQNKLGLFSILSTNQSIQEASTDNQKMEPLLPKPLSPSAANFEKKEVSLPQSMPDNQQVPLIENAQKDEQNVEEQSKIQNNDAHKSTNDNVGGSQVITLTIEEPVSAISANLQHLSPEKNSTSPDQSERLDGQNVYNSDYVTTLKKEHQEHTLLAEYGQSHDDEFDPYSNVKSVKSLGGANSLPQIKFLKRESSSKKNLKSTKNFIKFANSVTPALKDRVDSSLNRTTDSHAQQADAFENSQLHKTKYKHGNLWYSGTNSSSQTHSKKALEKPEFQIGITGQNNSMTLFKDQDHRKGIRNIQQKLKQKNSVHFKKNRNSNIMLEPLYQQGPNQMTIDFIEIKKPSKHANNDDLTFSKNLIKRGLINHQRKKTYHDVIASKGKIDFLKEDSIFESSNSHHYSKQERVLRNKLRASVGHSLISFSAMGQQEPLGSGKIKDVNIQTRQYRNQRVNRSIMASHGLSTSISQFDNMVKDLNSLASLDEAIAAGKQSQIMHQLSHEENNVKIFNQNKVKNHIQINPADASSFNNTKNAFQIENSIYNEGLDQAALGGHQIKLNMRLKKSMPRKISTDLRKNSIKKSDLSSNKDLNLSIQPEVVTLIPQANDFPSSTISPQKDRTSNFRNNNIATLNTNTSQQLLNETAITAKQRKSIDEILQLKKIESQLQMPNLYNTRYDQAYNENDPKIVSLRNDSKIDTKNASLKQQQMYTRGHQSRYSNKDVTQELKSKTSDTELQRQGTAMKDEEFVGLQKAIQGVSQMHSGFHQSKDNFQVELKVQKKKD